jgi:hypothetical protein
MKDKIINKLNENYRVIQKELQYLLLDVFSDIDSKILDDFVCNTLLKSENIRKNIFEFCDTDSTDQIIKSIRKSRIRQQLVESFNLLQWIDYSQQLKANEYVPGVNHSKVREITELLYNFRNDHSGAHVKPSKELSTEDFINQTKEVCVSFLELCEHLNLDPAVKKQMQKVKKSVYSLCSSKLLDNLPDADYDNFNGFVGRKKEIKSLENHIFNEGSSKLLNIHGQGGVGKTAIARKLCERIVANQRQITHIIWISAKDKKFDLNIPLGPVEIDSIQNSVNHLYAAILAVEHNLSLDEVFENFVDPDSEEVDITTLVKQEIDPIINNPNNSIVIVIDNLETLSEYDKESFTDFFIKINKYKGIFKVIATSRIFENHFSNQKIDHGFSKSDSQ